MTEKYDVAIAGAGIVGCATARALSRYNLSIAVLEAGSDVAEGASKANSAIVHAGFDAAGGTEKAKYNVLGNAMFENLCRELKTPFARNGSLVLAFGEEDEASLDALRKRGMDNGVPVEIISREELRRREPNVSHEATAALWAPTGGICLPYDLTFRLAENAAANGAVFAFDTRVSGLERLDGGGWRIECRDGRLFEAKAFVNCAGVYSDMLNNLVSAVKYNIEPRRGEYLMIDKEESCAFTSTIFQTPTKMGKGILVSPTVDGTIIVGPTAEDVGDKDDKATTYAGLEKVKAGARRTWPELPLNKVINEFSGLRAHETTRGDFVVGEAPDAPGFYNALGIESPGLTSAPAIGEKLADEVAQALGASRKNPVLVTKDAGWWPVTRNMDTGALAELVEKDPSFGRIVCRCELVTEGEIRAAIRARVGARTLDGIKRRTRCGMGRCQGGFCTSRLIELLGTELGTPPEEFLLSRKTAPRRLAKRESAGVSNAGRSGTCDVLVVGAGPAGLAAACAAKEAGAEDVIVLERDESPGGILLQCIHTGFGLQRFKAELAGPEYAQRYIDLAESLGIPLMCGAGVFAVKPACEGERHAAAVTAVSPGSGLKEWKARAVVLATGCRERPRGALMTPGTRQAGVYTAGTMQRLVNIDGIVPGRRAVILGSSDIGLIMARRLVFSGMKVLACIEIQEKSPGLLRNKIQCLDDIGIPLMLRHTVTEVEGRDHVTGVKVAEVDERHRTIPGTEIHFDCDTLILSCGLIPESELAKKAGIEIDPETGGPLVDAKMATRTPGVFACGNAVKVYDIVDGVSEDSAIAGRSAAEYALALKNAAQGGKEWN
ncbi:MAG: FAD-dependent oxidoreductase [Kiritimatiellae bacterium]|nr:FAD-dependent oxidoreductase [Kiritimatiellia bacterium]